MKLPLFSPEKDPSNYHEVVIQHRLRGIDTACSILEGVYTRTYGEELVQPELEELDVRQLEVPQGVADVDTKTVFTEMNIEGLSRLARQEAQMYSKGGLFIGGDN